MPNKYAIAITEDNLALIHALNPIVHIDVNEDTNRFFVFNAVGPKKTTEHDVVQGDDLPIYDGNEPGRRIIIK